MAATRQLQLQSCSGCLLDVRAQRVSKISVSETGLAWGSNLRVRKEWNGQCWPLAAGFRTGRRFSEYPVTERIAFGAGSDSASRCRCWISSAVTKKAAGPEHFRRESSAHSTYSCGRKRRGGVKALQATETLSDTVVADSQQDTSAAPKKRKGTSGRKKKTDKEQVPDAPDLPQETHADEPDDDEPEDYDGPPLVCCFGEALNEFLPSVRVSKRQMDPDIYSTWKMLQWSPPEFARAPGGPASNTAIALSRLGGRVAFMGKLGRDEAGQAVLLTLNTNRVQTRAVRFIDTAASGVSRFHLKHGGKVSMELALPPAEAMFTKADINLEVLKETKMFYFTSLSLTTEPLAATLTETIDLFQKKGADVFFDLNLPLPLWQSQEATLKTIEEVWFKSNFVELTRHELEFLLGEEYYAKRRKKKPAYYVQSSKDVMKKRLEYHYEPREIEPLWHEDMKCIFVTDGTYRIHYYTRTFHGSVAGTEDVLVTPFTCDRTGSGDALVAGIIRKITAHPEILQDQTKLDKALRFAICAGIIAQWTIGGVRGLPTESAAQNLTEQVYPPAMIF